MDWMLIKEYLTTFSYKIILALLVMGGTIFFITVLSRTFRRVLSQLKVESTLKTLLVSALKSVLWILAIAIVLNILGFKEISLALGGSIMVVGLGLANSISNVAADLIAGIFLLADDDFRVGSQVESSGVKGVVESLDIRKTKIRDQAGNLHIIANRKVDNDILVVYNK